MTPSHSGSIRLFRFAGIQVFLHWSWFLLLLYEVSARQGQYSSPLWNAAECITVFAIVTLHEFGHSLACRQVGGQTHDIILWPFGGIAFVSAPPRPGATLWSIAAGPLVNVALVPVLFAALWAAGHFGWTEQAPDVGRFLVAINVINIVLLVFNLLPVYPLDGGQILRSLLWYGLGRAKSLQIAAVIGIIGVALGTLWRMVVAPNSILWTAFLALFLGQRCWMGLKEAKFITALERAPRHTGFACPSCHHAPPGGPIWLCANCRRPFDPFSTNAICPHCQTPQATTTCVHCGADHPIAAWRGAAVPPPL